MTNPATRWLRRRRGIPLAASLYASTFLQSAVAQETRSPFDPGSYVGPLAAIGLIALAVAGVLFAIGAMQRSRAREQRLSGELAAARRSAAERSALLLSTDTPLYLYPTGAARPRIFGPDQGRLERVLRGPDGLALAEAIKRLRASGEPFTMQVNDAQSGLLKARGRAAGRETAIFLESADDSGERHAPAPEVSTDDLRLRGLFDAIPLPLAARAKDGKLIYANPAYAEAAGAASPAAAIAAQAKLFSDEPALAESAMSAGSPVTERRFAVIGGQRRALEVTAAPAGDTVAIAVADESGAAEARDKLQRHIGAYEETLNRLKTAVAVFGADQKLSFYNKAYVDLWRLDPTWLAMRPSEGEILERLREARLVPEEKSFAAFKRARAELYASMTAPQEEIWHLPDGTTLRIAGQPHPFGGLLYLYEDMTEQLSLERRYNDLFNVQRSTLDHLHEGVAFFGTDGRLKLWNVAFADLWGLEPHQLENEPHFEKVALLCAALGGDGADWDKVRGQVTGAAERTEISGDMERSDDVTLRYAAVPMPDGATLMSFVDMTDAVRAEQSLLEKNEALVTAARLKTDFIGHVSYQLIVPLTSIIGFTEAVQAGIAGPLNAKQDEYLGSVLAASAELKTQIDNMVDLAAIDAGELKLDLHPIEPVEFLTNLKSMVQERCNKAGLELVMIAPDDLGTLIADPARMKQVMFNLLTNAITYTPSGEKIEFGAAAEGAGLRFWVRDTGPGFEPEQQARAFERFESSRVGEAPRGPGLGLALVRSIVQLHGGWVSLRSRKGEGTEVTCHLPRSGESPALPGFEGFGDTVLTPPAIDSFEP
ncbi:Sensor protein DivL [Alphaproteobacteria bacterium SO-S41]|nr:Sensor protein DivL [Alphaproteobacteria bacterium SO-S41]